MRNNYIAILILAAALSLGCVSRGISQRAAISASEKRATSLNLPIQERSPEVTLTDNAYIVTYAPKTNERSGSWVFMIDKMTGEVKDVKIWR